LGVPLPIERLLSRSAMLFLTHTSLLKEMTMKRLMIAAVLLAGFFALSATEADAFVCARGVYRAGCVGPGGGVVVHRSVSAPIYRGRVFRR
jgi:hypothetical protein